MGSGTYQITFSAIVYKLTSIVVQPCTLVTLHYKANRGLARVKQRLLGGHVSGQLSMAHIGSEQR